MNTTLLLLKITNSLSVLKRALVEIEYIQIQAIIIQPSWTEFRKYLNNMTELIIFYSNYKIHRSSNLNLARASRTYITICYNCTRSWRNFELKRDYTN